MDSQTQIINAEAHTRVVKPDQELPGVDSHGGRHPIDQASIFDATDLPRRLPHLSKAQCLHYVTRNDHLEQIRRGFASPEQSHGALTQRVLLWGSEGHGKRQLAIDFALEFARKNRRKIIWIEGRSAATFMRDYCFGYCAITGKPPPRGVSAPWLLHRVKQSLSERQVEWFMVVFDVPLRFLSSSTNEAGLDLRRHLPRGQILITHSVEDFDKSQELADALCRSRGSTDILQDHSRNENRYPAITIGEMQGDECALYLSEVQRLGGGYVGGEVHTSQGIKLKSHAMTLVLACGVARLRGTTLTKVARALSEHGQAPDILETASTNLPWTFSHLMSMFMEALQDISYDAIDILWMLMAATEHDTPVALLEKACFYTSRPNDFEEALQLLVSTSVIQIRVLENNQRYVDLHRMVYAWLDAKYKETLRDRGDTHPYYLTYAIEWLRLLDSELGDSYTEDERLKYWTLLPLVLSVFDLVNAMEMRSIVILSLHCKVGGFLVEHIILPGATGQLLENAIAQYRFARKYLLEDGVSISCHATKLYLYQSKFLRLACEPQQAYTAIGRAWKELKSLPESIRDSDTGLVRLEEAIFDQEMSVLLRLDRTSEVRLAVAQRLRLADKFSQKHVAELYEVAACCSDSDYAINVTCLQNSHMAMSYWLKLPRAEQWDEVNFGKVAWLDSHCGLLLLLDKSRGALTFLPQVLEISLSQFPPNHSNTWRLIFLVVRECLAVAEYREAEKWACRVMSRNNMNQLDGLSLTWALLMLDHLSGALRHLGRFLEAEGVARWCLQVIEDKQPTSASTEDKLKLPRLWLELVHDLLVQGKYREAEAARNLSIERGDDFLASSRWKAMTLTPHHDFCRQYDEALQAAHDRLGNNFNSDDSKLDGRGAGSFGKVIRLFGDPFERIERENEDFRNDIHASVNTAVIESEVLDCLGFTSDWTSGRVDLQTKPAEDGSDWATIFQRPLTIRAQDHQYTLTDFWPRCLCYRKRLRSTSVNGTYVQKLKRSLRSEKEKCKPQISKLRQPKIDTYFKRSPDCNYMTSCISDCPCVVANTEGPRITAEIESERIFNSHNPHQQELDILYKRDVESYKRHFGPRPPIPYGMQFYERWRRKPKGPTEPGDESNSQQCTLVWTPDFLSRGDASSTSGFVNQKENYILSNPCLGIGPTGQMNALFELPSIVITSYKRGEKVRSIEDKWSCTWKKNSVQMLMKMYLIRGVHRMMGAPKQKHPDYIFLEELSKVEEGRAGNGMGPWVFWRKYWFWRGAEPDSTRHESVDREVSQNCSEILKRDGSCDCEERWNRPRQNSTDPDDTRKRAFSPIPFMEPRPITPILWSGSRSRGTSINSSLLRSASRKSGSTTRSPIKLFSIDSIKNLPTTDYAHGKDGYSRSSSWAAQPSPRGESVGGVPEHRPRRRGLDRKAFRDRSTSRGRSRRPKQRATSPSNVPAWREHTGIDLSDDADPPMERTSIVPNPTTIIADTAGKASLHKCNAECNKSQPHVLTDDSINADITAIGIGPEHLLEQGPGCYPGQCSVFDSGSTGATDVGSKSAAACGVEDPSISSRASATECEGVIEYETEYESCMAPRMEITSTHGHFAPPYMSSPSSTAGIDQQEEPEPQHHRDKDKDKDKGKGKGKIRSID